MSAGHLRFWGVRGSYPAPFSSHLKVGGNTSCVEVRVGEHLVVCDAGSGIIPLGNELLKQDRIRRITIVLTHYHWDHISGLPFFVPAFLRGWHIDFYGPGDSDAEVERLISEQMKAPYFPVETETWLADINYHAVPEGGLAVGPIDLHAFNVHHPGSTMGYAIEACGKRIVYASDNELSFIDRSIEERLSEFDEEERSLLQGMQKEEHQRSIEFMQDMDILIHDAQYTPEDYAKKRGWGHSCYIDTVNCAIDARVKHLYLFHVDPAYDDDALDALLHRAEAIIAKRRSKLACSLACEGMEVELAVPPSSG